MNILFRSLGGVVLAAGLVLAAPAAFAEGELDRFKGIWLTPEKDSEVEIYGCGEAQLCARIISLVEPLNEDGDPKLDIFNEDESMRSRPMLGLEFVFGFDIDPNVDGRWSGGRVYNPRDGKTYKGTLTLKDTNTIKLRGYVGVPLFFLLWVVLGTWYAVGFAVGALASASAGFIGMGVSVRANVRVAEAAKGGFAPAFGLAFQGGAVTGLMVVGLGLLTIAGLVLAMQIAGYSAPDALRAALDPD